MESGDEESSRIMYRQDDEDLVDKYNRPNVPMLQANPMRDAIIDAAKTTKELFMDAAKSPKWALDKAFTAAGERCSLSPEQEHLVWCGPKRSRL